MAERVRAALVAAARDLVGVSDTPRLDAELLMAHALGDTRETLLLRRLDEHAPAGFAALLARRLAHEPIAYITGSRDFWTIRLAVGPGALVPRADSETLVEAAVAHFAGSAGPARILDLGTGPGTLLLACLAEWPSATGLGIDLSDAALAFARGNGARLGIADRAEWRRGDWAAGVDERFDLVLANPPYIGTAEPLPAEVARFEPASALYAGSDGLDAYRELVPQLPALIAQSGVAMVEIGATQADSVAALARAAGFATTLHRDLAGRPRAIAMA
ncbi:peptide chain release factor N(5)-glutamine methyltransferase [Sphingomonas baiyangensis]|uniref:Release factor glutamine methyltransferase n=1 Tax=Sphingomonas baiyangensis TaxID=2572576 RepID=A0A4U1L4K4_9SPHN|nr:peptide chain release factor N(5)-glutamine methyltransferase [Sphingomonas baiyangensis]TKD51857.1 peptide chain release factor N(5)-glutamine methyltransferase [Sphingomonas baiyangensis]